MYIYFLVKQMSGIDTEGLGSSKIQLFLFSKTMPYLLSE